MKVKINGRFAVSLIIIVILLTSQVVFLFFIPSQLTGTFIRMRPLIYAAVIIIYSFFTGSDERPVPKKVQSFLLGGFGTLFYCAAVFITGFFFGFGKNMMAPDFSAVINNVWIYAAVALMSEFLRLKLIKSNTADKRNIIAVILTLTYTFAQLDILRGANADSAQSIEIFFVSFLPVFALNAVLTYMAYEGVLLTLILMRCSYSLLPVFMPVMPNINKSVWAMVLCTLLFVTAIFYHINISGSNNKRLQRIAKKRIKYHKKPIFIYIISVSVTAFSIFFLLRFFMYFPVVILTGSMTGTINRGDVAIIEKLHSEDIPGTVREGDIILYKNENIEIIHRVVEVQSDDSDGKFYITKGDANSDIDISPVKKEQIIGIFKTQIPFMGYPVVIVNDILRG